MVLTIKKLREGLRSSVFVPLYWSEISRYRVGFRVDLCRASKSASWLAQMIKVQLIPLKANLDFGARFKQHMIVVILLVTTYKGKISNSFLI